MKLQHSYYGLENFIKGLKIVDTIEKHLKIYYDNLATIFFSKNNKVKVKENIST